MSNIDQNNKKSFGLRNGKKIFEGFNDERKVKDRKIKEKKRLGYEFFKFNFETKNNELPKKYINSIIQDDSLKLLKKLPDNCVDLVFTSPPYNFGLDYENHNDTYQWNEYFKSLFKIFDECIRVLKYGGRIIVISSIAGITGSPVLGAYSISKTADLGLVRSLATEWGPKNITVNALCPGLIKTDFARALWEDPETLSKVEANAPLKRIGVPDEVAGAAVLLASESGAFITGQKIVMDGGVTITS